MRFKKFKDCELELLLLDAREVILKSVEDENTLIHYGKDEVDVHS